MSPENQNYGHVYAVYIGKTTEKRRVRSHNHRINIYTTLYSYYFCGHNEQIVSSHQNLSRYVAMADFIRKCPNAQLKEKILFYLTDETEDSKNPPAEATAILAFNFTQLRGLVSLEYG